MEKIKHSLYFRTIAVTLIFTFLLYDITWAQGGSPLWGDVKSASSATQATSATADVVKRTDITIPHETGRVSYSAIHSSSDDLIINIQDAHASLSAQQSIVKMLDSLASNYDLNLIAVEGSEGYVDTSLLKTFPDKNIRKKTAETLMQEGKMSAGEFFAATSDKDIALYGIEDNVLYNKNLELLKTVMNDGREAIRSLDNLSALLRRMEEKIYSPRLKKFMEVSRLHRDARSSFADYWNYVSSIARENSIDINRFGNIARMLASIELEKVINFDLANDERKILIDELSKRIAKSKLEGLVLKSVGFKAGKISQGAFHKYLADLADEESVNPAPFKNLINFAKYVSIYEEIDVIALHSEFAALEASIMDRLFSNDDEKALYGMREKARILKGLFDISLSNGDTDYMIKHKDEFNAAAFESLIDRASQKYGIAIGRPQYDLKAIFDRTDEAIDFYNVVQERNSAMLKNTIWRMKEEGKHIGAIITGGFHSQGISELMKEQGLSYMVIMPKFKAGEDRPYIAILTKKPEPYQALVKSGEYKLAVYQYFSTGDIKDLAYAIALNLKEVSPASLGSIKNDWAEKYKLAYGSMPKNREKSISAKRLTPEEFGGILKLFTAEKIVKLNQANKAELNGEKVLGIIGYGKPLVTELPVPRDTGRGALEELPPKLPEPGEFPLFEGSPEFKTEETRGVWGTFAQALRRVVQNIHIPWRHKHPIVELKRELARTDPESFNIKIVDDHVLIATRKRPGSSQRIAGMMGRISGLAKAYEVPPEDKLDYNNNRITVEVHSFKAENVAAKGEALAALQSNDINYSGNSTIPNYTTAGLLAQLVEKEYKLEKPAGVKKYANLTALEAAMKSARGRLAQHIAEMSNKDAGLARGCLNTLDITLSKFDLKAHDNTESALNALHDCINEKKSATQDKVTQSETDIPKLEEAVQDVERKFNAGDYEYAGEGRRLRKELLQTQGNRDNFYASDKALSQFWFYLLHPEGSFDDITTEIRAVETNIPEGAPIILFVKILEPIKLDLLKKRYNIQGIVAYGAAITSHWVVYAKQNDIPVVIVDMIKQRDFSKEVETAINETRAALESNREEASRINKKMAIISSDSIGRGEVILRPHIETIRAMKSMALSEIAIDKVAREQAAARSQEVNLGYTDLKVTLMANADNIAEAKKAADYRSAGLGLVRTEYLFADENIFEPDKKDVKTNEYVRDYLETFFVQLPYKKAARKRLKENLKEYFKALAKEGKGLPVTIRMIDFEPDKKNLIHSKLMDQGRDIKALSGASFYKSDIGADILSLELEAALEAYIEGARNIRVLFPMVNSMEDVRLLISSRQRDAILEKAKRKVAFDALSDPAAAAAAKDEKLSDIGVELNKMPVGIMIETDEARHNSRELIESEAIDFYSIGTNDFSRFVMAKAQGLDEPLDRDSPLDKNVLSKLQTEVLTGVTEILQVMRDVNRKRITENSRSKELCFCGEMASWYNFMVFLVMKSDKLDIKPGEIPMSLSMAGYRVPEAGLFLESIKKRYYKGVETFLKSVQDELGTLHIDHVAGRIAEEIFNHIKIRGDVVNEHKAISEGLGSVSETGLLDGPDDTRTLFTLELLSRKDGVIDKLPSKWKVPVRGVAGKIEGGPEIGSAIASEGQWAPSFHMSESFTIKTSKGMHQRAASELIALLYRPKYKNKIEMVREFIQWQDGSRDKYGDAVKDRLNDPNDIMSPQVVPGDIVGIRIEGTSEALVREFVSDIFTLVDTSNDMKIFEPVSRPRPPEPHAFKLVSKWSFAGLGGGLDWITISTGLASYLVYDIWYNWDMLFTAGAWSTVMLAIISLMFTVTSFIRVWASVNAIHFAHPNFSIWRILKHDIGHDIGALNKLQEIAPHTYENIIYHETFKNHVPALSAFIPLLARMKDILVKIGVKSPQEYWIPDLHNKYARLNADGAITGTGSLKYDKALSDAMGMIERKGLLAPEQLRLLRDNFSIVPIQNREYLADVYHDPSGEGWIVAVNEMLLDYYQADQDVATTKLAYILARQFDYIFFENLAYEYNIRPMPSLAETTTITLLRDTSRLNEHKDDCQKLLKFHKNMRILEPRARYFSFEDHYSKLLETIQSGGFYGINFIGQPAWLDHIVEFYKRNRRYYGAKGFQPFDSSITALDIKHILKYLRWYEGNAKFLLKPQLDDDKAVLAAPDGREIPLYYDGRNKLYTKEDLRDRLIPPEDKDFLFKTVQKLHGKSVDMADVSAVFAHYLGSGNKKAAFSYVIVTKDGPFEFVMLLPRRNQPALVGEDESSARKNLLDNITELELLEWASVQYSEHAPNVGSIIFDEDGKSVIQMSVSYAGKDLYEVVGPANKELTAEAKLEFIRACFATFTGSLFRLKGFQNVGDWKPSNTALLDWNVNMVDFGRPVYGDKELTLTRVLNFAFLDGMDWGFPEIDFNDDKVRSSTYFNGVIDVFANYAGRDRSAINEPYRIALGIDLLVSLYEERYRSLDEINGALYEDMKTLLADSLPRLITSYKPSYLLGEKKLIEDFNWEHVRKRFAKIDRETAIIDFSNKEMAANSAFPTNPYWYIAQSAGLRERVVTVDELDPEEMKRTLDVILMDHMAVPSDEYLVLLKKFAEKLNVDVTPPASKEEYRAIIRTLSEQVDCLCQNDVIQHRKAVVDNTLDGDMILGLSPMQVRHILSRLTDLPQNYQPVLDNVHVAMRKEEVVLLEAKKWLAERGSQEGNVPGDMILKAFSRFLKLGSRAKDDDIIINKEQLTEKTIEYSGKIPNATLKANAELLVNSAVAKGVTRLVISNPDIAEEARLYAEKNRLLIVIDKTAPALEEVVMPRAPSESLVKQERAVIKGIDDASLQHGITPLGYENITREKDIMDVLLQGSQSLVTGNSSKSFLMDGDMGQYYFIFSIDNSHKILEIEYFGINKEAAPPSTPDKEVIPTADYAFRAIIKLANKFGCSKITAKVPASNKQMTEIFGNVSKHSYKNSLTAKTKAGSTVFTYKLVPDQVAMHKTGKKLFDEPVLDIVYEDLYKKFNDIAPKGGICLDPNGIATIAGRFERDEKTGEFKRDKNGRLVPVKDDAYLGLIDLSILPGSPAVKMLNQIRDEISGLLPKEAAFYKVEDAAYHITILIIQEMIGSASATNKDLEKILAGFKKAVSGQPSFKLRLEGLRIGADGGVVAVWKDSGEIRHMRGEFNKKVLFKYGGTDKLVKDDDKDRRTIHTTLLRLVTDVDPATLAALKRVVEQYKNISSKNIVIDVNQVSVCHESRWLHAEKHMTIGTPVQLKKPKGHAFKPVSAWSLAGLGGGLDWAALFGALAYGMFYLSAKDGLDSITGNFNIAAILIGSYFTFTALSALFRSYHSVRAVMDARPEMTLWQAMRHDIGHDDKALESLKDISHYSWYQIEYHELFKNHVSGLLAFFPGIINWSGAMHRVDEVEKGRERVASAKTAHDAGMALIRLKEIGASNFDLKKAGAKLFELSKKENREEAAAFMGTVRKIDDAVLSSELKSIIADSYDLPDWLKDDAQKKLAELLGWEHKTVKLKAAGKGKIVVGVPKGVRDLRENLVNTINNDRMVDEAIKKAARTMSIAEEVSVVFIEGLKDEESKVKYVESVAREEGAAIGIVLDENTINSCQAPELELRMRDLLSIVSQNIFTLANPDIAYLDETRARLMDRDQLMKLEKRLSPLFPRIISKKLLEADIYNLRMEAVARQVPLMDFAKMRGEVNALSASNKLMSVRVGSIGELKLLAEAHKLRMRIGRMMLGKRVPLKLQVRLAVPRDEVGRYEAKMPGLLKDMRIDEAVLTANDIKVIAVDEADKQTVAGIAGELAAKGYKKEDIAVVDRVKADRPEADVPDNITFVEYDDDIITPYHYDAALEAMSKPGEPVLCDRYKKWYKIKPMQKFDFEQLRREIDQYQKVMMAA